MSDLATITVKDQCLLVAGELNFNSVMLIWQQSLPLLKSLAAWSFDFSAVTSTNSAALALLLEWRKLALSQQKTASFHHLSEQLVSLAKVAGVDTIL